MTSTTTDVTTAPVEEFVERLEELGHRRAARGDLARLRRCAGRPLGECPEAFQLFYRLLPYSVRGRDREEELYFLVATLFALNPRSSGARDFGATMAALATSRGAGREGVDRRVAVLLDAPLEDLRLPAGQLVALAPRRYRYQLAALARDLLWWDHPARRVQRRWARSYFGGGPSRSAEKDHRLALPSKSKE